MSVQPLEDRVANLERMACEYEEKMATDDRLTVVVQRLAEETRDLSAILAKVDEQQQKLNEDLNQVRESSATKEDLSAAAKKQAATTAEFRRDTFRRILITGFLVSVLLGVSSAVAYDYQEQRRTALRQLCESRNEQNAIVIEMLEGSIVDAGPNMETTRIRAGIARFEALITDCDL